MKYCGQCGTPNEDKSRFCTSCGAPLEANTDNSGNFGADEAKEADMEREEIIFTNVAPRSIVLSIVLSIVTCGIYGLYWMYELNNEVNELAQDPTATSSGLVLLFTFLTCGIYGIYWSYKMGQKCDEIAQRNNDSNILYMLLSIFGLGIVTLALIQDTINHVLE